MSFIFEHETISCIAIIASALVCAIITAILMRRKRKPIYWPSCLIAVVFYGCMVASLLFCSNQLVKKAHSYDGALHTLDLEISGLRAKAVDMSSFLYDGKAKIDPERANIIQQKIESLAAKRSSLVFEKINILKQSRLVMFAIWCTCLAFPLSLLIVYLMSLAHEQTEQCKQCRINLEKG